jgi:hypothetical protein
MSQENQWQIDYLRGKASWEDHGNGEAIAKDTQKPLWNWS